jgi:hypothetical protein
MLGTALGKKMLPALVIIANTITGNMTSLSPQNFSFLALWANNIRNR